jgi:type II secretory pathway pseudopilin PulG
MIAVWLIPYITLSKSFCFPALGKLNSAKIVFFLISNPIGSMWSMLTRQEAFRRIMQDASEEDLGEDWPNAMEIATVAAAAEELSWQNRATAIVQDLRSLRTAIDQVRATARAMAENATAEEKDTDEESKRTEETPKTSLGTSSTATQTPPDNPKFPEPTPASVKDLFTRARYELISHRDDSQIGTWVAVITLIGSIVIAFVKNVTAEQRKYLPRTVAIVSLGFYFVALVQISGNIGAFGKGYVSLKVIRRLQDDIKRVYLDTPGLFPFAQRIIDPIMETDTGKINIEDYLELNPIWRPNKSITSGSDDLRTDQPFKGSSAKPPSNRSRRSPMLLFFYSFCTVSISYGASLYVSYKAARRPGFGCQCLLWTCIYAIWLGNAANDWRRHCRSQKQDPQDNATRQRDWNNYVIINSICASLIILSLLAHISGFLNVCACNAGSLIPGPLHYVNLYQPTDEQWRRDWKQGGGAAAVGLLLNCLIILFLSYDRSVVPVPRRAGGLKARINHALEVALGSLRSSLLWTLSGAEEKDMNEKLFNG